MSKVSRNAEFFGVLPNFGHMIALVLENISCEKKIKYNFV